ncbi:ParB/RepB/Spo0J family partition protein [Pannus brasiliensis CCIBt3594]|uniref:ParB/RepB/Spo0J family partition protein n=1 Tax=Pannus brasiliensis CCIBt3594 TaxID=1427578 RepID=A0AAW9QTZ1_9CHRO
MTAKTFHPEPLSASTLSRLMDKRGKERDNRVPDSRVIEIELALIDIPENGPRKYHDPREYGKLKDSIAREGVLENIIVRRVGDRYEVIAGTRRVLCSRELKKTTIPGRVIEADETEAAWIVLIENLVRDDFNPIEETDGILRLLQLELGEESVESTVSTLYRLRNEEQKSVVKKILPEDVKAKVENVFTSIGKKDLTWKSFMTSRLPLRDLPEDLKDAIGCKKIEYSKARLLARVDDPTERDRLLNRAIAEKLSVTRLREELENSGALRRKPSEIQRVQNFGQKLKNSRPWENPERWHKIEELLEQIEELLDERTEESTENVVTERG